MNTRTIPRLNDTPSQSPQYRNAKGAELLGQILAAIEALRDDFNEYARVNLEARYPYGKPTDRWRRRS